MATIFFANLWCVIAMLDATVESDLKILNQQSCITMSQACQIKSCYLIVRIVTQCSISYRSL